MNSIQGSPKQIAWIEKIIASKNSYAEEIQNNKAYMPEINWSLEDWEVARELINSKVNRANAWIEYIKDVKVDVLVLAPRIQSLGELSGSERQIPFGESMRICKVFYALDLIYQSIQTKFFAQRVEEAFEYLKSLPNEAKFWIEVNEGKILADIQEIHRKKVEQKKEEERKAEEQLSPEEREQKKEEMLRAKGYSEEDIKNIKKIDESLKIINEQRKVKTNSNLELHYDQLRFALQTKNIEISLKEIEWCMKYLHSDED